MPSRSVSSSIETTRPCSVTWRYQSPASITVSETRGSRRRWPSRLRVAAMLTSRRAPCHRDQGGAEGGAPSGAGGAITAGVGCAGEGARSGGRGGVGEGGGAPHRGGGGGSRGGWAGGGGCGVRGEGAAWAGFAAPRRSVAAIAAARLPPRAAPAHL